MPQSKVDPVYKYIDAKAKLIRRDIQRLEQSYNATLDLQEEEMLRLNRFVAKESIINTGNIFLSALKRIDKPTKVRILEQKLTVLLISSLTKIDTSNHSLDIAIDFKKKCNNKIHKLGLCSLDEPL